MRGQQITFVQAQPAAPMLRVGGWLGSSARAGISYCPSLNVFNISERIGWSDK